MSYMSGAPKGENPFGASGKTSHEADQVGMYSNMLHDKGADSDDDKHTRDSTIPAEFLKGGDDPFLQLMSGGKLSNEAPDNAQKSSGISYRRGDSTLSKHLDSLDGQLFEDEDKYNPFQYWDQDEEKLTEWATHIDAAIDEAVGKHHKGFTQSTHAFNQILGAFNDSQTRLSSLVNNLSQARKLLLQTTGAAGGKAPIFKRLWDESRHLKQKIEELDKVEYYLDVPYILNVYLSKKQYVHAAILMEDAIHLHIHHLKHVKTLENAQESLAQFKNHMYDIFFDEMMAHLYLKTPYLRDTVLKRKRRLRPIAVGKKNADSSGAINAIPMGGFGMLGGISHDDIHNDAGKGYLSSFDSSARRNNALSNRQRRGMSSIAGVITDPSKIVIPTYKSLKTTDFDGSMYTLSIKHLLLEETSDAYLKNPTADLSQFLRICLTSIHKLGRSVGTKTRLYNTLAESLEKIVIQELEESQSISPGMNPNTMLTVEQQSEMLRDATDNVFKLFNRILENHLVLLEQFEKDKTSGKVYTRSRTTARGSVAEAQFKLQMYSKEAVWSNMQRVVERHLQRYLKIPSDKRPSLPMVGFGGDDLTPKIRINAAIESGADMGSDHDSPGKFKSILRAKKKNLFKGLRRGRGDDKKTLSLAANTTSGGFSSAGGDDVEDDITSLLSFSFEQSNEDSIVRNAAGRNITNRHVHAPSEFAARDRGNHSMPARMATQRGGVQSTLFAADDPSAADNAWGSGKAGDFVTRNMILPSPYHITALFRPVITFIDRCEDLLSIEADPTPAKSKASNPKTGSLTGDQLSTLRLYLKKFVSDIFIPQVDGQSRVQMGYILLEDNPFEQLRLPHEYLVLLRAAHGIYDLVKQLFDHFTVLPVFDPNSFTRIISNILARFHETCDDGGVQEITVNLVSRDIICNERYMEGISDHNLRSLLVSKGYHQLILEKSELIRNMHTHTHEKRNPDAKDIEYEYYSKLIQSYEQEQKLQDKSLSSGMGGAFTATSRVFDTTCYSRLAIIATGLYWLGKKLRDEIIAPLSKGNAKGSKPKSILGMEGDTRSPDVEFEKFLTKKCDPLAEHCISTIRVELRSQCVCLLQNMSKSNYWLQEATNKPEDFIIRLNKLLVNAEFELNEVFPEHFVKFIFVELAWFICRVLIHLIPTVKYKRINHRGFLQLNRNIFSLQQNLTTITQQGQEKAFDRASKYLELSQKKRREIEKLMKEEPKFSDSEYKAILEVAKVSERQHQHS